MMSNKKASSINSFNEPPFLAHRRPLPTLNSIIFTREAKIYCCWPPHKITLFLRTRWRAVGQWHTHFHTLNVYGIYCRGRFNISTLNFSNILDPLKRLQSLFSLSHRKPRETPFPIVSVLNTVVDLCYFTKKFYYGIFYTGKSYNHYFSHTTKLRSHFGLRNMPMHRCFDFWSWPKFFRTWSLAKMRFP